MISKGILFNDFHTYSDWGLVLTDVNIPPAISKTAYIDIPGRDEPLDFTEYFGEIRYDDRKCQFSFAVHSSVEMPFEEKKAEINNAINGKMCKIILDADNEFYYYGRVQVEGYTQKGNLKQIVITAKTSPYKMRKECTVVTANVEGEKMVQCFNLRKSVVPTITSDADFTLKFHDVSVSIAAGENIVPDIKFTQGENLITCMGTGTITFTYQEGSL